MTTTAATCTQPGCGGTIDGGYCTVCGMAAAPVPVPAPVPVTVSQGLGSLPFTSGTGGHAGSRGTRAGARGSAPGRRVGKPPPVPPQDPGSAVLADPQVAESKRFCPRCEHPVGRAREGRPGLTEGFCRNCGAPLSFTPKLPPGG